MLVEHRDLLVARMEGEEILSVERIDRYIPLRAVDPEL